VTARDGGGAAPAKAGATLAPSTAASPARRGGSSAVEGSAHDGSAPAAKAAAAPPSASPKSSPKAQRKGTPGSATSPSTQRKAAPSSSPATQRKAGAKIEVHEFDKLEAEIQAIVSDPTKIGGLWSNLDFNGNGVVSLAEIDKMLVVSLL
jgi:hypothetical protein